MGEGIVAAYYYQAMIGVESRLAMPEDRLAQPPGIGQLVALVDSLREGTLNAIQVEAVRTLRTSLEALAEREASIEDVKVPNL